ncbi:MAG TPA: DUF3881 family protein [Candidatus Pullilachnospira intestinigallinarum]|nr:DUF3881 family protein [Candidatus Pullilachnospira intestinigallinarum]
MHSYLRAVGFPEIRGKSDMDRLIREVIASCDEKIVVDEGDNRLFAELSRDFGYNIGITVCGAYDEKDEFQAEYCFPFFRGTGITSGEDVAVERHAEKESFAGACDDVRIGVTLIFYLQNAGEYLDARYKGALDRSRTTVTLSGLSVEGKVLLPVKKDVEQAEKEKQSVKKRCQLIHEARQGNEDAMESLTMEDMDTYSMISRRISREDVFSIVESYFMPYGMECDRYNVLGEILEVTEARNTFTGEKLYQMTLLCNDMQFDVCINQKDLMGVPREGRRFKGIIWLQGAINF